MWWQARKDGKNYGFGGGPNFGGTVPSATAFATRHDGNGYLVVASDGGVFVFSNRRFLGSLGGKKLSAPIIGIKAFSV